MPRCTTDERAQAGTWLLRGRQLGVGVLVLFTIKGICTSAVIFTALMAAMEDGGSDLFPHLLVWTVACIGGFCMLGGWRRGRNRSGQDWRNEIRPERID